MYISFIAQGYSHLSYKRNWTVFENHMFYVEASIPISAESRTLWEVLMQTHQWSSWNTYVTAIQIQPPHQQLQVGSTQVIQLTPDSSKPDQTESYTNTVISIQENAEFVWEGVLGAGLIFKTVHWCRLEQPTGVSGDGHSTRQTRFVQGERFSGLLAPVVWATGKMDVLKQGYERMNADLRDHVERPH